MSRIIFHIDVNSAFLSWTAVEKQKQGDPLDLRSIPAIIGGDSEKRHGIVLAKSLSAQKLGIQTGEPIAQALRKCPTLVIESPDFPTYRKYSQKMMEFLHTITPDIQQVSIDECYLDYTPIAHLYPSPEVLARQIQDFLYTTYGFTVNVGIAPNKLLAKMASDFEKPNRIHTLFYPEIPSKMWPLPVSELFMTGRSSVRRLTELGIRTIGDLAHTDPDFLIREFQSHGKQMWEYANGIDDSPVDPIKREAKNIGNSITLSQDVSTRDDACHTLLTLAESVGRRLREAHQIAGSLTVEIRYYDFSDFSHQMQLLTPTQTTDVIYQHACELFDQLWNGRPIRLLGIRSAKLLPDDTPVQLSIFDLMSQPVTVGTPTAPQSVPTSPHTPEPKGPAKDLAKIQRVDAALDAIRKKYGTDAVTRASLLTRKKNRDDC